ncbi:MAG: UDP-N-acetylmuramoyl-tripeptide--D-alanyl-D-alanine ligase, partial [bacterium]
MYEGAPENLKRKISGVSIDSRKILANEIYFAIRGENHDGHDFVQEAFHKQAVAAVVENQWWCHHRAHFKNRNVFVVEESINALQELANFYRKKFSLPVIALTGTNGKTTTKEMMAAVLARLGNVCKTESNLNNHIGVPLTLLALNEQHKALIVEMGANHFGEIARLCEIAEPQYGLITNIGHGHLEFFQNLEGVTKAKMELFEYLYPHGTAFINIDDPLIVKHAPAFMKCIKYGFRDEARVIGKAMAPSESGFARMMVQGQVIELNLRGNHNLSNALVAVAVGLEFGVSLQEIKTALAHVKLPGKRMEVFKRDKILVLNDSYNANPDSTLAALEIVKQTTSPGKKIFVFGDMLELGDLAPAEHARIGKSLKNFGVDIFLAFGPQSAEAVRQAQNTSKNMIAK